jgi:hypothetical protein
MIFEASIVCIYKKNFIIITAHPFWPPIKAMESALCGYFWEIGKRGIKIGGKRRVCQRINVKKADERISGRRQSVFVTFRGP